MNRLIRSTLVVAMLAAVAAVFVACDDTNDAQTTLSSASSGAAATESGPAEALPANLILDKSPDGAQDVIALQKSAKAGDTVTLRGRVGGNEKPLADNRAIVTVVDPTVTTCERMPGDACKTPWDACCEPSEKIAANSATVQVVDSSGKPLAATLESIAGLKPLSKVTVSGTARRPAGSDVLIIEAKQIHVTP